MDKVVSGNYDKIMKLINKTIRGGTKVARNSGSHSKILSVRRPGQRITGRNGQPAWGMRKLYFFRQPVQDRVARSCNDPEIVHQEIVFPAVPYIYFYYGVAASQETLMKVTARTEGMVDSVPFPRSGIVIGERTRGPFHQSLFPFKGNHQNGIIHGIEIADRHGYIDQVVFICGEVRERGCESGTVFVPPVH
jgi:hypothetical protein